MRYIIVGGVAVGMSAASESNINLFIIFYKVPKGTFYSLH